MIVMERYVVNLLELFAVIELSGAGAGAEQVATAPATSYIEVERVAYSGAGAGAIVSLYAGNAAIALNLRDGSLAGSDRNFADENSLIRVAPNVPFMVGFTGGTASAAVPVWIQAQAVTYRSVDIDAIGRGSKIANGIAVTPGSRTPDPGGWN